MESNLCTTLNKENCKGLLDDIDTILFDCDGVLYRGNEVIKGAPEAVHLLKLLGKRIFYVTNNSSKTRKQFEEKCLSLGFPVVEEEIITSGFVASLYLKNKLKGEKIYCIGSENLVTELKAAGLSVISNELSPPGEGGMQKATNYIPDPKVGCVVVGVDESLTYLKAAQAARYLSRSDCLFVATNLDPTLPVSGGIFLPGAGSCVTMVETASQRTADVVCGKPSAVMFDVVKELFGVEPSKTLMVGDRLDTDIAFANKCGMRSLLVLTGSSSLEDVSKCESKELKPQFNISSLANISSLII